MSFWAPTSLNQIIGNAGPLELLRAIIGNRDRAPQAYCFEGPHGVGKNVVAKLFLQQMLPEAKVALITPDHFAQTLNQEDVAEYPCMIWDHAHRITKEQADTLAALMDRASLKTVFIFISAEYDRIPQGIRARALRIPLTKPSQSDLTGLLGSICAGERLNFELDALNLIATRTHGVPSRAIQALHAVSLLGDITAATVAKLQVSIEEQATQLLTRIALGLSPMEMVAEVKDLHPTEEFIDAMFSAYSTQYYDSAKSTNAIAENLSNYKRVGEIFIKWKSVTSPPPASLFIMVKELLESNRVVETLATSAAITPVIQRTRPITQAEMDKFLEEASQTGDSTIR